jgi:hypothetical protein
VRRAAGQSHGPGLAESDVDGKLEPAVSELSGRRCTRVHEGRLNMYISAGVLALILVVVLLIILL